MQFISLRESALLVVDVQQGFTTLCPRELPVPGGLEIVPAVNRLLALDWARIDASQDWNPPDHRSFLGGADNLYPPHCVQGTPGADFVPGLATQRFHAIWRKGYQRDFEAYAVTAQHPGMFALYRVGKMAPQHPEWKQKEPFKSVLTGDREAMSKFTESDWRRRV